jgi:hypothetical protein
MWVFTAEKMTTNRAYLAHIELLKSRLLSQNTKLKLYETVVRRILKYAAGIWTMTTEETNALRIFERNTARTMCGPVKEKER